MFDSVKYKEKDLRKIDAFVEHLLSNPGIKNEPVIVAGELIRNFLVNNRKLLSDTFKNPQFFPELEWEQITDMIFRNMHNRILASSMPVINNFIDNTTLSFFDRFSDSGIVDDNHRKKMLHEFIMLLLDDRASRFHMNSVVSILSLNVIDRYIGIVFRRRDFLYNELVRVQKINLEAAEYINFLKTVILIRSAVHLKIHANPSDSGAVIAISELPKNNRILKPYLDEASRTFAKMLPGIPAKFIRLALVSNLHADFTEDEEAAARLLYILCSRYQHHRQIEKIDRGAEPQDKSWFSAARKNSGYFGYDKRIIEDLYIIAGDNNW